MELIEAHEAVLPELEEAVLCKFPPGVHMTSKGVRLEQSTMGTFLCSAVRDGLRAECALINAGVIRASRDYEDSYSMTYGDLKGEFAFESRCCVVPLPGKVVVDLVAYSRRFAAQDTPLAKGCYLQLCNNLNCDEADPLKLTHICGQPVDPDRLYECAVLFLAAENNLDALRRMVDHLEQHGPHADEDGSRPVKQIVVSHLLGRFGATCAKLTTLTISTATMTV